MENSAFREKKYILVVGASSGIGAAVAKELSDDDSVVILMARRRDKLQQLQKELPGESLIAQCDVCDYAQISDFFNSIIEKQIKLSSMIYTAGVCYVKPLKTMAQGDLDKMFATNVFGFYEMCRQFQSQKISERGSTIVVFSSYASVSREKGMSAYAMTKSAINTAVTVLAKELIRREIRINAILPANTTSLMGSDDDWTEEAVQELKSVQPLGLIPLEEVTKMVRFLLSDYAKHITGDLLEISAGYNGN